MPPNEYSRNDVDEPVEVVAYDPAWPEAFKCEQAALLPLLSPEAVAAEHFGSTAVPGLTAKPVVDVLIGLRHYPPSERVLATLSQSGYVCLGEAGVPGRHYCRKREAARATGRLLAYSERKADVMASLLERARAWAGLPSGAA
ncbi:Glutamate-rich protein GrpB [Halomicronema hongdechloris C2206]|uniref:Glutamate-rich protein GrpB n=1 Tax=Halomicronema hongdechloris C2206 TaxID=1641165 RepID=A0A1Z3HNW8_9CYAN|nr:GrpB family protein [Halomicronema hongdechloris]ASC71999.1 Glutamate-rich protein GrpB [Halomicronema hongdechloris C2206]